MQRANVFVCGILCFAVAGFAAAEEVKFPEDRSLGTVMVTDPALGGAWTQHAEAKGTVTIPADRKWGLKVDSDAAKDLAFLKGIDPANFELLDLSRTDIDDKELAVIERFPHLSRLALARTKITDAGVKHLTKLKKIVSLDLSMNDIGDEALTHLKEFEGSLRDLNFSDTKVTDGGLNALAGMKALRNLDLAYTEIGDAGMEPISKIKTLEFIYLQETKITDAATAHLKHLPKLQQIEVFDTGITKAGADVLREALHDVRVKM